MPHFHTAPRPLAAERSSGLQGVVSPPGDRLLSHLALVLGAVSRGETTIEGLQESADVFATGRALQAFGVRILKHGEVWRVAGLGVGGLLEPQEPLHCSSSTTTLQLCMGLAGPLDFVTILAGDPPLEARSQAGLLAALAHFGVGVLDPPPDRLPFSLRGARLPTPAHYRFPAPSAGIKAAMLLGALAIPGVTTLVEPLPTHAQAEDMFRSFGARLAAGPGADGEHQIEIEGLVELRARHVAIPGDLSLAATIIVAALLVPDSEVLLEGVLVSPSRLALVEILRDMGGQIDIVRPGRLPGGEPMADIRVLHSPLRGIAVPPERLAWLADEFPLLAVAAACAEGETSLEGLAALLDRDSDQVAAVIAGLAANGVAAQRDGDRLAIAGTGRVRGRGRVLTHADAALAMAFLVLGMAADEQVTVDDQSAIAHIYPRFIDDFEALGARFLRFT
jgi:3-phosphoshikimate 1-carboxyvinyltransferase